MRTWGQRGWTGRVTRPPQRHLHEAQPTEATRGVLAATFLHERPENEPVASFRGLQRSASLTGTGALQGPVAP